MTGAESQVSLGELARAIGIALPLILAAIVAVQLLSRRAREISSDRHARHQERDGAGQNDQPSPLPFLQAPAQDASLAAPARSVPAIQMQPIDRRMHTVAAAGTGGGKTTTMYTLLIYDLARGVHPIVASPQFTPYHPDHQRIDLRPLMGRFEVARKGDEIQVVIDAIEAMIEPRYDRYYKGGHVGEHIAIYLGEWEEVTRLCGVGVVDQIARIAEQGRVLNLWIGFMEIHDGLVKSFGGDSGFRKAFPTRLVGNDQDETTWRQMIGRKIGPLPVPRYHWAMSDGHGGVCFTPVVPPSREDILAISRTPMPGWSPVVAAPQLPTGQLRSIAMSRPRIADDDLRILVRTPEPSSSERTAFDSQRTEFENVRTPSIQPSIVAFIARELGLGTAPSKIAKKIPGYRADNYPAYKMMVDVVAAMLGEHATDEEAA